MSGEGEPGEEIRDALSAACELVGRFQYHFAKIEQSLNIGIATLYGLNGIASDIVCANLDFVKKINIVKSQAIMQFNDTGPLIKLLDEIAGVNNPHRQNVIHSSFEPHGDGVRFTRTTTKKRLDRDQIDWTKSQFENHFSKMDRLAKELETLVTALKPYKPSLDFSDPRNSQYLGFL